MSRLISRQKNVEAFSAKIEKYDFQLSKLELVSKELNHLAAILHVYAGSLIFMKKKNILFFKKEK